MGPPQGLSTRDLPLAPATSLAAHRHVIVSVPLERRTEDARFQTALAARFGTELVAVWPLTAIDVLCLVFEVPEGRSARDLSGALAAHPDVLTSAPIADYDVFAVEYRDDLLPAQRALTGLNIVQAHQFATGRGVRVAVIDSGVQTDHPDLRRQVALYRDFTGTSAGTEVAERHGTAMAAIIAADARNGVGMVGVAPEADVLALRACWATDVRARETCNTFSLARALNFSLENDATLINMSLGGPRDDLLANLLNEAAAKGIPVVAAHTGDPRTSFPATHESVIAASDRAVRRGKRVIYGPGVDVLSARHDGSYDFYSGPSVAAAHVSGVLALLAERFPRAGRRELQRRLSADLPGRPSAGALDACLLLRESAAGQTPPLC
ncbi:MAG: S8 family serine peptidase [Pseudomonadota bacterium]